jgi:cell division protein FtsX
MGQSADSQAVSRVGKLLARTGDFTVIIFIPKAVALAAMKKQQPLLVKAVPYNPFPDSYKAVLKSPARLSVVTKTIRRWQGVATVRSVQCPPLTA